MIYYLSLNHNNQEPLTRQSFITLYKKLGENLAFTFTDSITYGNITGYENRLYLAGKSQLSGICVEVYANRFDRPGLFIHSLFIKDERQNSGVGTACVNGVIAIAKEIGLKFIVLCASPLAEGFWRKMGFKKLPQELEEIFWPSAKRRNKDYAYKYIIINGEPLRLY